MRTHKVVKGDTLARIAIKYNVRIKDILALNPQIKDKNYIQVGWMLKIPEASADSTVTAENKQLESAQLAQASLAFSPARENNTIWYVGIAAGAIALFWNNRNKGRPA